MKKFVGRVSINLDLNVAIAAVGIEVAEAKLYEMLATIEQSAQVIFIDSKTDAHAFGVDHMEPEVNDIYEDEDAEEDCEQWTFDLEEAYKR